MLQPTFHNSNSNKLLNNASRSYSKCSGKKDGCGAPANPCSKSKPSTCPDPNQRVISPCKSRPPCTPAPEKCEPACDKPKCPPPCPPPAPKCPPPPCPPPPPKCPPPCPPPAPTCFPPPTKCPRAPPKCPPPYPPRPCDPCPKPCKPPKCPPRCPLDPPPPCPPPPPPKCPEPPKKCCDKPKAAPCPPPKQTCPKPCSGPRPAPHCPTPRESCSAPKRSCEVPLQTMLEQSRKKSPPKTTCCPPPTPPPPRSICCPSPPKETCCPPPKPMPNCVPPETMPKSCPEQKASCPPPTPTCVLPEPSPPCCPKEPPCPPAKPSPCGCTPAPEAKGSSACFQNMGRNKKKTTRQSFWKKLTRKMSTQSGNGGVLKARQPRFKLHARTFGIAVFNLAANRGSKCKTGKDICAELDPVCKRLCKKKPATRCSAGEKPSCDERIRIAKKAREAEDERSQKRPLKCPTCLPPERCQPPLVPPVVEKMEYPATVCAEAPPCPSYKDKVDAEPVLVCPPLPQLPKPPSAPVVLCPCPPPPKLPPGPCPCLDSAKEVKLLVPIYLPPCTRRPKYTCDRKVYSCKLQRECDKRACPRDDESHLS
ncbi:formin-like protein 14 isoform X2 [Nasonia vitripennis]|nr:formin-like protein 14 isoform X2 [Nasonia vitripennis]